MTGIEMLRDVCKALKGSPWCGTDIATIGGELAYEKLRKIADQIERETLPRPLFEDGTPVQFGDDAAVRDDVGEVVEMKYQDGRCVEVTINFEYDSTVTHYMDIDGERVKRPSADTWERIEADARKFAVFYCDERGLLDPMCNTLEGDASTRHCTDCGCSCEEKMALDLVRRCKELAGVE